MDKVDAQEEPNPVTPRTHETDQEGRGRSPLTPDVQFLPAGGQMRRRGDEKRSTRTGPPLEQNRLGS